VYVARPHGARRVFTAVLAVSGGSLILLSLACGSGNGKSTVVTTSPTSPTTPAPTQPDYPSTPPVPITWSPQTSPLPAPSAEVPPPPGSNDFPLTISNPTDSGTVTSPLNVVASANPKNPIFFMRVYVDQLAVYYTFSSDLGNGWEDYERYHDPPALHEAALRMGVNLFVYAVTSRPTS